MTINEKGSDDLAAALSAIGDGLDDLTGAAGDTVSIVVARARRLAPVDTGALARSLSGRGSGSTATISSSSTYAMPVHFGVPARGQRANPFLHKAVEQEQSKILAAYTTDVDHLIEQKV